MGFALIKAIGQGCCGWLVDDTQNLKAGNLAGILGGLALGVVKISRNRNHRLGNTFAQVTFRGFFHLLQNKSGNLARAVLFSLGFYPGVTALGLGDCVRHHFDVFLRGFIVKPAANQALDCKKRVFRVGDSLAFCRLTNQTLALICKGDD